MAFPISPTDGQIYNKTIYNGTTQAWEDYLSLPTTYPSNENLLAHYSLSDGDGVGGAIATYHLDNNALDSSGNGHHGTTGSTTEFVEGKSGLCAKFDGTINSIIEIPSGLPDGEISISMWFKSDTPSAAEVLFRQFGGNRQVFITEAAIYFNTRRSDGSTFITSQASWSFNEEEWVHVVGIQSALTTKLFINSILLDSDTHADIYTSFTMDGSFSYDTALTNSSIDEVNIFDRALTQAEINELYTNPRNENLNLPAIPNDPIGQWDLNGDSNDSSGNGLHLTAVGTPIYEQGRKDNEALTNNSTSGLQGTLIEDLPQFSFALWVKPDDVDQESYAKLFHIRNVADTAHIMYLQYRVPDEIQLTVRNDSDTVFSAPHYTSDPTNWIHFGGVFDGTTLSFYVNGTLFGDVEFTGTFTHVFGLLGIGTAANIGLNQQNFQGLLEQVKIFDRVLSNKEILALAEQTHPIKDNSLTRLDGYIKPPISYSKTKKGKGINFASNYSGVNIGKIDIGHDGTISTWFNSEGDTGRFQTILTQADTAFGYAIFLSPVTGYLTIQGAGVNTTITTDYFDNTSHFLVMKWDSSNVYVLVDGIVVYSSESPANTLRNSDFIIGNREGAGQIQEKSFIGGEYTNLVADPCDLSLWSVVNCVITDSGMVINGEKLWEIKTLTDATAYTRDYITPTATVGVYNITLRKGSLDAVTFDLYTASAYNDQINVTFDTKLVQVTDGTSVVIDEIWHDDDTVTIYIQTTVLTAESHQLRIFASSITDEIIYVTMPQFIDNTTTMFPFVDGTHSTDYINRNFVFSDKFTIEIEIESLFAYNTSIYHRVFAAVENPLIFLINYHAGNNTFQVVWRDDGGGNAILESPVFDDGTSLINLNQKIKLIVSLDLSTGDINTARLITVLMDTDTIYEDTNWSLTPTIKTNPMTNFSIGSENDGGGLEVDSFINSVKIYDGYFDDIVTDIDDVDTLLENKMPLFNFETKENHIEEEQIYQGYNFNGVISDVRFYDTMLTTKETRALMTRDK